VNANPRIIREFYDAAGSLEEFEERRSTARETLDLDDEEQHDNHDDSNESNDE
jgi:hypothetical protein